jgi:hypothetical protein
MHVGPMPPSNLRLHQSGLNSGNLRKENRRHDSKSHHLSGRVEIEEQSIVNQEFCACNNDSSFEFVDLRSMKIKHTPMMLRWKSGRNQSLNPWKIHGDLIPSWITPPRGDAVLPQFRDSRGCIEEKCKAVVKKTEEVEGLWGKIPESDISRNANAESAHLCSPPNPKPHTYISSPVHTSKPQIERFVGHFWGRSQKSYASVVKANCAPIVVVKMQPRGAGRRGAAHGYGRGSGRDHVWRRIEDGAIQNQKGGRTIEEADMGEDGDTLNQGNPSPWEGQVNRSEEKNEDSWKGNPHPMGEDGPKDSHVKKEVTRNFNLDRSGCAFCHFKNHLTKDCRHHFPCDICGTIVMIMLCLTAKNACHGILVRNFVLHKLRIKVFFYIEERVDNRMIKEKSSTAIITVVQGNVGEKQIELEFMNMLGNNLWRWSARSMGDNKFVMRFPDPKMIGDLGYFRPLGMRTAKA